MSSDEFFGWGLAILGAVCLVGWLAWEAFHAPTEVESTPLDDLLEADAVVNVRTEYPESLVLHSGDDGDGQRCFDCGAEAQMHMPWAVAEDGQPVEAALCFKCAAMETSTATTDEEA